MASWGGYDAGVLVKMIGKKLASRFWWGAACFLLASGCASREPALMPMGAVVVKSPGDLPAPTLADFTPLPQPYVIGPYDKLDIIVVGLEDLSVKEAQVDTGGNLSIPLAGIVRAAGRTPGDLATDIEAKLRQRYVRDPRVAVNVREIVSQTVTVDGEVKEPGAYPVAPQMTLMRAIASAKGTTEYAKLQQVTIFRTVDSRQMAALYDLRQIRRGAYEDPRIYPNDVVVVGNSQARRIFRDILQAAPLITSPIVAYISANR